MKINSNNKIINGSVQKEQPSFQGKDTTKSNKHPFVDLPKILLATAGMFLCLNTASPKDASPVQDTPTEITDSPDRENTETTTYEVPSHNITNNFRQGKDVGNCVGVSTLKSFTRSDVGEEYLNSIVTKDNNQNSYIVSFPNIPKITINNSIITKYNAVEGNDYVEAITFALYKDAKNLDDNGNWKQGKIKDPRQISLSTRGTFKRLTGFEPNCSYGSTKDLKAIQTALDSDKKLIMTTSFRRGVENTSNYKVFPRHEFELIGVDTEKNVVKLADPWNIEDDKIFEMNIDDFQEYNDGINLLGIDKDEKTGKIFFYNPDIGTKPGETNYEDYFQLISYNPTTNDINDYFNDKEKESTFSNNLTLSFWDKFDHEGYEKHIDSSSDNISISTAVIKKDMPVYTMLKAENKSPIELVKQYMLTKEKPVFNNPELNQKSAEFKDWLELQATDITYEIQTKHYNDSIKAAKLQKKADLAAKKQAEEDAKKLAEQQSEQTMLQDIVTELANEVQNYTPEGYTGGVAPSDVKFYKNIYPNASYNVQTKKMYYTDNISKENITISFDKAGHVQSVVKKKNGQIINETKYSYPAPGVKVGLGYNDKSDLKYIERKVYDNNGKLIADCYYNNDKKFCTINEYIIAPNGKELKKSCKRKNIEGYHIDTNFYYEFEYEFNEDGSMREKREYIMTKDKNSSNYKRSHERKTVYLPNQKEKLYWDNEYKAYREKDKTYDGNGNILNNYTLSELATIAEN